MKKMILMLAMALPIIASAQKIAHVNSQEIMALMPETKQMGAKLDSVQGVYETQLANMQEEFNKKVAEFQQQQSTMSASILEYRQQELAQMEQRMQVFYQTIQQDLQAKQVEYLQPIREKLLAAINKVAAAQACTYVMDQTGMLYIAPDATDLTPAVKAELGIKWSTIVADGYLESRYAEYEQRKAAWLKKKKNIMPRPLVEKPEDEAL